MQYEAAIRTVSWASVLVAGATYIQAPAPVVVRLPEPSADSVIYRLTPAAACR